MHAPPRPSAAFSPPPPRQPGRALFAGGLLLLLCVSPLHAAPPPAPADCPATPAPPQEEAGGPPPPPGSGPITLLPALPGGGFAAIPLSPQALAPQTCIPASPPLPKDVLHGDPDGNLLDDRGDEVLDGPGGGDPLRGP